MMSARSGKIKMEVQVVIPRPRSYAAITTPYFIDIKRQVFDSIREETLKSMAAP